MIASQTRAMVIPIVPKRSGFLRPTRSKEDDKEQVEYRTDDVVDAGDEKVAVSDYAQILVEDGGVVAYDVDANSKLV